MIFWRFECSTGKCRFYEDTERSWVTDIGAPRQIDYLIGGRRRFAGWCHRESYSTLPSIFVPSIIPKVRAQWHLSFLALLLAIPYPHFAIHRNPLLPFFGGPSQLPLTPNPDYASAALPPISQRRQHMATSTFTNGSATNGPSCFHILRILPQSAQQNLERSQKWKESSTKEVSGWLVFLQMICHLMADGSKILTRYRIRTSNSQSLQIRIVK